MQAVADNKLIFRPDLHVAAWLKLTIAYVIFFHPREGDVGIGFAVAVPVSEASENLRESLAGPHTFANTEADPCVQRGPLSSVVCPWAGIAVSLPTDEQRPPAFRWSTRTTHRFRRGLVPLVYVLRSSLTYFSWARN
jgi:hypothetical protein